MAVRDVVQAAAGVGGGDNLYVEDVFSTYLYTGNGAIQTIENGIALGDSNYGPSVDFDGTNDYLSRSSDLTGNTDSKTFTFSGWVFLTQGYQYLFTGKLNTSGGRFNISTNSNRQITLFGADSVDNVLYANLEIDPIVMNTWVHLLVSVDLSNTGNRSIYMNDVAQTVTWNIYVNRNINFTYHNGWNLGADAQGGSKVKGRLSNFFLDYTYRDLSVTNNRRLFITADGQPATGQASLSPILYMPLDGSTATVGTNSGTGGDFTVNGSPTVLTQGGPYTEAGYGKGGMVWSKARNNSGTHRLNDSVRGVSNGLRSDSTAADQTVSNGITAFNSDGYALGTDSGNSGYNFNNYTYASWTFRKAEKFFDVVTWTGDGVAGREIAHSLDSVPGMVIVKNLSVSSDWAVWQRSLTSGNFILLNSTAGQSSSYAGYVFGNNGTTIDPTSTHFTVGSGYYVNASGDTYVAYVFAHNAGGFGADGAQNVISCGSFTTDGAGAATVSLGYEPQWLMFKASSGAGSWFMYDNMRGFGVTSASNYYLLANSKGAENNGGSIPVVTSTGFSVTAAPSTDYIYIAIRRPMKTPESGTEVFAPVTYTATSGSETVTSGFPVDVALGLQRNGFAYVNTLFDRFRGTYALNTASTAAESNYGTNYAAALDSNTGIIDKNLTSGQSIIQYMFKRVPGFMDVVATPQTAGTVTHNLGVAPEFIILKGRDSSGGTESWRCYHAATGRGASIQLNLPDAPFLATNYWGTADPTATEFGVAWGYFSSANYIAYLFASLPGVSKVGSYSGTGGNVNVDCGFSAGARFILIKRTDPGSTGDWYVWDSARGIVAGNDPYLLLNSTAAEVTTTDYIDPLSSGFTVTSSAPAALNASGGTYIFLAIA